MKTVFATTCLMLTFTADGFRTLIDRAKPLKADDPSIIAYHCAPWCAVTFETKVGRHIADLCLGRGFLQYPDGRVVRCV